MTDESNAKPSSLEEPADNRWVRLSAVAAAAEGQEQINKNKIKQELDQLPADILPLVYRRAERRMGSTLPECITQAFALELSNKGILNFEKSGFHEVHNSEKPYEGKNRKIGFVEKNAVSKLYDAGLIDSIPRRAR